MNKQQLKSNALLLLAALIWGVAFVAQSDAMNYVGAFTFNGARFVLGALALAPLAWYKQKKLTRQERADGRRPLLTGALWCGLTLGIASGLQQHGLIETSAGKAGFLTALYVVLVPLIGLLFKRKVPFTVWIGAVIAVAGMYLLCIDEKLTLNRGDALILMCALVFAVQMVLVDHYAPKVDGITLACLEFAVAGVGNMIPALIVEHNHIPSLMAAWLPLLYTGLLSSGVAYTLQILGQRHANAAVASLILSLESVFAALSGWLFLHETLLPREAIGSVLMLAAVILAQIPISVRRRNTV